MQDSAEVPCPFCGCETEIAVETSLRQQEFTIDCENCCRPISIQIACEDGEVLSLNASPG